MDILKPILSDEPKHPAECPFAIFENSLFNPKYYPPLEALPTNELAGKVLCGEACKSVGNYRYMELALGVPELQCQLTRGDKCWRVIGIHRFLEQEAERKQ